jgi:hydroxymethylpyrimidine/phosphomethylpyrimidine kinase
VSDVPVSEMPAIPTAAVLVIAGTDSSAGAGVTRDVRVLADFAVDALCAVTAVTAQSNSRVAAVHHVPPTIVREQITSAFATRPIGAIKTGMLGTRATVDAVADALPLGVPLVIDPVLLASSGGVLLDAEGQHVLRARLFPRATLVTPNIPELATLLGEGIATDEAALLEQGRRLLEQGPEAILIKGGHASGDQAMDLLIQRNAPGAVLRFTAPRIPVQQRGTGCALASAIAAGLALGLPLESACRGAKGYLTQWLASAAPPRPKQTTPPAPTR